MIGIPNGNVNGIHWAPASWRTSALVVVLRTAHARPSNTFFLLQLLPIGHSHLFMRFALHQAGDDHIHADSEGLLRSLRMTIFSTKICLVCMPTCCIGYPSCPETALLLRISP